jgi:NADH:ubiquinone oxidoreductase subunit D
VLLRGKSKRFAWLCQRSYRYLAIDGGAGAHLLAELAGCDLRLRPVSSPRHADLLIVIEPVNRKLAPAVAEVARALPRPAHAILVGEPGAASLPVANLARLEELLPAVRRVGQATAEQVLVAIRHPATWPELAAAGGPAPAETTIQLPPAQEREIATELAVLSLGPIQPFTAGPLRLLLVCDGEQILSAQVEAGYAARGIAAAMLAADWREGAGLACQLDPLAPVAGRLTYVRALEQLQRWRPALPVVGVREGALLLERAQNHLWWLTRFAMLLDARALTARARKVALALTWLGRDLWTRPPIEWIAPQEGAIPAVPTAVAALRRIAHEVRALEVAVRRDRFLAFRTRGIGLFAPERLDAAGASGPVLQARAEGAGDVQSRLLTRLRAAAMDVRKAADGLAAITPDHGGVAANMGVASWPRQWSVPAGEVRVAVTGPRGRIELHLVSAGGNGPTLVEWQRPSAALLPLVPDLLAGQKLADAEVIVASLDLAMAEADG